MSKAVVFDTQPGIKDLWFLPLGGCGEIGMNLNLYGHAGQWLMVDCGVTFYNPLQPTAKAQVAPQLTAEVQAAATHLRTQLDACRHAAYSVYTHLDAHGVSVGIVFRLRQLRERVLRAKSLLDCLQSAQPERATAALLADLAQMGHDNRSLRALIASSSHLTAAKVAERSAESGEHYITRDAAEYRAMLRKAAGGGATQIAPVPQVAARASARAAPAAAATSSIRLRI